MAKATGAPGGPLALPNIPVGTLCRPRAPQNQSMPQPSAVSRTPVELEPPLAVASTLGSLGHHLDPTDIVVVAQGSFSPPQSDTGATAEARSELAAGRSTAAGEAEGFFPHRPTMGELGAREPSQGEGTVDLVHYGPVCGLWTSPLGPP